jgi:hypothetical protein
LDIPAIFADGRAIVELKTATGAFDPSGKSPIDRYLRRADGWRIDIVDTADCQQLAWTTKVFIDLGRDGDFVCGS